MTAEENNKIKIQLVAVGARETDSHSLSACFLSLADATINPHDYSKFRMFDVSKGIGTYLSGAPGTIYELDSLGEGKSIFPASATVLRAFADDAVVAKWCAEDRAARASAREHKARKKDIKDTKADPIRRMLEPLRKAYRRLPAPARAQLLARIVHILSEDTY